MLANILFQTSQKEGVLTEAHRILKQNGRLVVIDWKKGANGFGPPESLRTDPAMLKDMVVKVGFSFDRDITAGDFHFGMLFHKA